MNMVFDLGNVFVLWNPRNFYRDVFNDDAKMEYFLTHVYSQEWILKTDCGITYKEAAETLKTRFPDFSAYIDMYEPNWENMFSGVIHETVDTLRRLKAK